MTAIQRLYGEFRRRGLRACYALVAARLVLAHSPMCEDRYTLDAVARSVRAWSPHMVLTYGS
jgi:hypothetical protein